MKTHEIINSNLGEDSENGGNNELEDDAGESWDQDGKESISNIKANPKNAKLKTKTSQCWTYFKQIDGVHPKTKLNCIFNVCGIS